MVERMKKILRAIYIYCIPLGIQKLFEYCAIWCARLKELCKKNGVLFVVWRSIVVLFIVSVLWHGVIIILCAGRAYGTINDFKTVLQSDSVEEFDKKLFFAHTDIQKTFSFVDYLFVLRIPYIKHVYESAKAFQIMENDFYELVWNIINDNRKIIDMILKKRTLASTEIWYTNFSQDERYALLEFFVDIGKDLVKYKPNVESLCTTLDVFAYHTKKLGIDKPKIISDQCDRFLNSYYDRYVSLASHASYFIGYPDVFSALLLIQNSNELRPTGGFIGTYGTVQIKNGQVQEFVIDNVYNLDTRVKTNIRPPAPFVENKIIDRWYLRDSNWNPDFTRSAEDAFYLYNKEAEKQKEFDMAIAINPGFIVSLLDVVGGVDVGGVRYTSKNFLDTLEEYTGKEFEEKGIAQERRKDVIKDISAELFGKLIRPRPESVFPIGMALIDALIERNILLYSTDSDVQDTFVEQKWSGSLITKEGLDYLYVVDANLGSMKTDPFIERSYNLNIMTENNLFKHKLTWKYDHTAFFSWKVTRYKDYMRIYLPEKAKILSIDGMKNPSVEHGKKYTVVSGLVEIEPKTSHNGFIMYTTPVYQGVYWQMQPGKIRSKQNIIFNEQSVIEDHSTSSDINIVF